MSKGEKMVEPMKQKGGQVQKYEAQVFQGIGKRYLSLGRNIFLRAPRNWKKNSRQDGMVDVKKIEAMIDLHLSLRVFLV